MNDEIVLLTEFIEYDNLGFSSTRTVETSIWGKLESVTRSEFYSALSNNITLETQIRVNLDDYRLAIVNGNKPSKVKAIDSYTIDIMNYDIVRSYNDNSDMILYCKRGK